MDAPSSESASASVSVPLCVWSSELGVFVPRCFVCATTQCLMAEPAIDLDGDTYERAVLERHLAHDARTMRTKRPMHAAHIRPNTALAAAICLLRSGLLRCDVAQAVEEAPSAPPPSPAHETLSCVPGSAAAAAAAAAATAAALLPTVAAAPTAPTKRVTRSQTRASRDACRGEPRAPAAASLFVLPALHEEGPALAKRGRAPKRTNVDVGDLEGAERREKMARMTTTTTTTLLAPPLPPLLMLRMQLPPLLPATATIPITTTTRTSTAVPARSVTPPPPPVRLPLAPSKNSRARRITRRAPRNEKNEQEAEKEEAEEAEEEEEEEEEKEEKEKEANGDPIGLAIATAVVPTPRSLSRTSSSSSSSSWSSWSSSSDLTTRLVSDSSNERSRADGAIARQSPPGQTRLNSVRRAEGTAESAITTGDDDGATDADDSDDANDGDTGSHLDSYEEDSFMVADTANEDCDNTSGAGDGGNDGRSAWRADAQTQCEEITRMFTGMCARVSSDYEAAFRSIAVCIAMSMFNPTAYYALLALRDAASMSVEERGHLEDIQSSTAQLLWEKPLRAAQSIVKSENWTRATVLAVSYTRWVTAQAQLGETQQTCGVCLQPRRCRFELIFYAGTLPARAIDVQTRWRDSPIIDIAGTAPPPGTEVATRIACGEECKARVLCFRNTLLFWHTQAAAVAKRIRSHIHGHQTTLTVAKCHEILQYVPLTTELRYSFSQMERGISVYARDVSDL